jgi:hypothetical protein
VDCFGWTRSRDLDFFILDYYLVSVFGVVVMMMMTERGTVDGMSDAFSNSLDTTAEGVIVSVVVVIAHITLGNFYSGSRGSRCANLYFFFLFLLWIAWCVDRATSAAFYTYLCFGVV